jgi:hypothetical protein
MYTEQTYLSSKKLIISHFFHKAPLFNDFGSYLVIEFTDQEDGWWPIPGGINSVEQQKILLDSFDYCVLIGMFVY